MESRRCLVIDGDDRWPGRVIQWRRDPDGPWRALVEYQVPHESGAPLTYLNWRGADELEAVDAD